MSYQLNKNSLVKGSGSWRRHTNLSKASINMDPSRTQHRRRDFGDYSTAFMCSSIRSDSDEAHPGLFVAILRQSDQPRGGFSSKSYRTSVPNPFSKHVCLSPMSRQRPYGAFPNLVAILLHFPCLSVHPTGHTMHTSYVLTCYLIT